MKIDMFIDACVTPQDLNNNVMWQCLMEITSEQLDLPSVF